MKEPSVLLIGGGKCEELLPSGFGDAVHARQANDFEAAAQMLAESDPPEWIVLAQSRPGEFSATSIDSLRCLAPLARIWRLLGSWCEGEPRSGQPPNGCVSIYWHQWPARWAGELARWRDGRLPSSSLPLTASSDERALAAAAVPIERRSGMISIIARHAETAAALSDVCRLAGYQTHVVRDGASDAEQDARAALWHTDADWLSSPAPLQAVRQLVGSVPLVALVTFPRLEDCQRAAEAGIAAVVSKPFLIQDLLWNLDQVSG